MFGALAKILRHSEENGLNIGALSIALAPAIVRKRETRENKTQMQSQEVRMAAIGAHVVELLVEHHETIFQSVRDMIVKAKEVPLLRLSPVMTISIRNLQRSKNF